MVDSSCFQMKAWEVAIGASFFFLAGVGVVIVHKQLSEARVTNNAPTNVKYEFVCASDGELSERHVGVYKTVPAFKIGAGFHSESWQIIYVDGAVAYYKQVPGETCQTIGIEIPTEKRDV